MRAQAHGNDVNKPGLTEFPGFDFVRRPWGGTAPWHSTAAA